ncbi:unnamed protein product, partial [Schistocephalus solidus]|uniref:leucine--tRNA ligase n=1 Tax=Schistocephalus solidus TaxID=70667 RepID=A0A183SUB1_SCHSO
IDRRGPNGSRKLVLTNFEPLDSGSPTYTSSRKLAVMSASQCAPWPEKLSIRAKSLLSDRLIPVVYDPSLLSPVAYETIIHLGVPDLDDHHKEVSDFLDLPPPPTRVEMVSIAAEKNANFIRSNVAPQVSGFRDPFPVLYLFFVSSFDAILFYDDNAFLFTIQGRDYRLYACSEHRKDWLVSRQRYWATPIPLIHCSNCGTVPVPESDLPVLLPPLEKAFKRGAVPLRENENWLNTTCPQCGGSAQRETDTLDTFVDSSWYYLRFLDPNNSEEICRPAKASQSLPVNIYVGGIEHAIRHLFYARFIAHFLYDLGITPCREPFLQFLPIGLVLGQTFTDPRTGRFYAREEVEEIALPGEGRNLRSTEQSGQGTPMGSPISGLIAQSVLSRLESPVFQHHRPKFWARYVDDTFVVIQQDQALTFGERLNAVSWIFNLQWTRKKKKPAGISGYKPIYRVKGTGVEVAESWEKMSKSKLNGVEPAAVVARHGLELTRLTMLASVGPHSAREWNESESEFNTTLPPPAFTAFAAATTTATTITTTTATIITSSICPFCHRSPINHSFPLKNIVFPLLVLMGVKHWQSRMWRLVMELSDFAKTAPGVGGGRSVSWPSADQTGDHLRRNRLFVREYARVVNQVCFNLSVHSPFRLLLAKYPIFFLCLHRPLPLCRCYLASPFCTFTRGLNYYLVQVYGFLGRPNPPPPQ